MQCVRPLTAYKTKAGTIVFHEKKRFGDTQQLDLPCGQCIGCRLERSRQWAIRCMHEKQQHEESSYVTLTLNRAALDELMPGESLTYEPFQGFMKRLREKCRRTDKKYAAPQRKIRFYMCGEYGEQCRHCNANAEHCNCGAWTPAPGRPHYHALLFGVDFKDKALVKGSIANDTALYDSPSLAQLWPYGHVRIGNVTFKSAAYVARYIVKKITGDLADAHYSIINAETGEITNKNPEFTQMSRRPGLGATWLEQYQDDVYPHGKVVVNGKQSGAPKYYDRKYKELEPELHRDLVEARIHEAYGRRHDNTTARLSTKEHVMQSRVTQLRRKL